MDDIEDKISILVFSDKQLEELLKYAKSPWVTITKMAIIQGTFDILIGYTDFFGKSHRVTIKNS